MTKHKKIRLLPMDELKNRPCEVDGRPALFHRWIEEDQVLLKLGAITRPEGYKAALRLYHEDNIVLPGYGTEVVTNTLALVEYRDGTIDKVDPLRIRFTDKECKQ